MTADHPISELMLLWEEAHQRGESASAEELCRNCPDLLPEVQRRIVALQTVYRVLKAGETERLGPEPVARLGGLAPTPFPDLPGYTILAELGHGGMGVVYRARQLSAGRVVALKMVRAGQLASPVEVERFRTEAETVALLDHPGIVPVYEVGEHQRQHYFSMKLIEGGSLAEHLDRFRADPRLCAALLVKVAQAVHYAHEHGILHRDLKPSNILLDAADSPHVTDFGLAKRLEGPAGTQSGAILGTPGYMAPEQAAGQSKRVTTSVDVYALGAVLYELLTGRPPFRGETAMDTLLKVLHDEPVSPSRIEPRVPLDLETICLKCLRKEPDRRYAGASALADDLSRFLAGEPIQARSVGPGERLVKWVRRRPTPAALITLAVAMVVGLVVGGWWYSYQEHRHAVQETALRERADDSARLYLQERDAARTAEATATNQRDAALLNAYVLRINRAQREWEAGRCGRVVELLEACRPRNGETDLRGFEWHYLWNLCHGDRLTLNRHTSTVASVVWSPDGRYLASAGQANTVQIWDATTGKAVQILKGHPRGDPHSSWMVVSSRDGQRLASATVPTSGPFSEVKIWETATGREVCALQGGCGVVRAMVFGSDGQQLITASVDRSNPPREMGVVQFWDAATGRLERTVPMLSSSVLLKAVLSPDGGRVVWDQGRAPKAAGDSVSVWDVTTGQKLLTLRASSSLSSRWMAFAPDGQRLATAGEDGTVGVWDVSTNRKGEVSAPLVIVKHPVTVASGAFSSDGTHLASADTNGTVNISNAATGEVLHTLKGHRSGVQSAAFSPDGQQLATASSDGTIKVWDAALGPVGDLTPSQWSLPGGNIPRYPVESFSVAFTPDDQRLAINADRVRLLEAATGQQTLSWSGGYNRAFRSDGQRLATYKSSEVTIQDVASGQVVLRIKGIVASRVHCLAYSPDGRLLVCATGEPVVKVWDVSRENGELTAPLLVLTHATGVRRVAFSPDGTRLVTTSTDNTVMKIWDMSPGREDEMSAPLLTIKTKSASAFAVAFSPDGTRLASAANEPTICIWDIATARGEMTVPALRLQGHTEFVTTVCWSPDGNRLVSAGQDRLVKIWETGTGQELVSLRGHADCVWGVTFSRDGQRLATASTDGAVKVWEAVALTPEVFLQRKALELVESLYTKLGRKADVLAHLRRDATLGEPLRREALARAERYLAPR